MDQLSHEDVVTLAARQEDAVVSIYLPVTSEPDKQDTNRIRLKNLAAAARAQLVENHGLRSPEADALLEPALSMLTNGRFPVDSGATGLALYLAANDHFVYTLPLPFQEQVVVGSRFYLKPLLPLLAQDGRFYILALSLGQVQLLESTLYGVHAVALGDGVPQSLDEAMQYDDPEQHLQWHTGTDSRPQRPAAFHGHGVTGEETKKENIHRYFQQIDAGLKPLLHDEDTPLLLAAVDYLLPLYREANSYEHLLKETLQIDPQAMSARALHKLAWEKIFKPYLRQNQAAAVTRFNDLAETDWASADLSEVTLAAHDGQIDVLLAARHQKKWGLFDAEKRQVMLHDQPETGDDELIDLTAVQTLLHSGTVYLLPQENMPRQQPVAAIFRFPNE